MSKQPKLKWLDQPDPRTFDDAYDFLSLHWLPAQAGRAVEALRAAEIVKYRPGDVLRAGCLLPLPLNDPQVEREVAKAIGQGGVSPPLCIQLPQGLVVADGYHRLSAAYHLAPQEKAPVKLAPSVKDAFKP